MASIFSCLSSKISDMSSTTKDRVVIWLGCFHFSCLKKQNQKKKNEKRVTLRFYLRKIFPKNKGRKINKRKEKKKT